MLRSDPLSIWQSNRRVTPTEAECAIAMVLWILVIFLVSAYCERNLYFWRVWCICFQFASFFRGFPFWRGEWGYEIRLTSDFHEEEIAD